MREDRRRHAVDVFLHGGEELLEGALAQKLDRLIMLVEKVIEKEIQMSKELDVLTEQVRATADAEASAILLLQSLSAQIEAIKTDPVALQALSDDLKVSADSLAQAVLENTPASEPPVEPPVE